VWELFGNTNPLIPVPDSWPMQNAELASLIAILLILVIFIPLAVNRYKKAAAR
jgi:ABC-2 type transport system permease protein